jgi:hypothetical protein
LIESLRGEHAREHQIGVERAAGRIGWLKSEGLIEYLAYTPALRVNLPRASEHLPPKLLGRAEVVVIEKLERSGSQLAGVACCVFGAGIESPRLPDECGDLAAMTL